MLSLWTMVFLLVLLYRKLAQQHVAHSGLIVHPDYRNLGLAKKIKSKVFDFLKKYPNAKVFELQLVLL
jgi:ribosomal protein S18 acetylase RimI-like enzyme